jgi:hypothetical protein
MYKYASFRAGMSTQKPGDYTLDTEIILRYSSLRSQGSKDLYKYSEAGK